MVDSEAPDTRPTLKIEFADTQNTEVIHDKLHKVNHILVSNLNVFAMLATMMGSNSGIQTQFDGRDNRLAFSTDEIEMQHRRVNTLFQRINAASGLV